MSHTVTIDVEFKDIHCLKKAVSKIGGTIKIAEKGKKIVGNLYQGKQEGDMIINLPGWNYPIVINEGKAFYDNYNGSWGSNSLLEDLKQEYSKNVVLKKAQQSGFFSETLKPKEDGTIRIRMRKQ